MYKKFILMMCTLLLVLFLFSGCSYSKHFYNAEDYDDIWQLSGYGYKEDGPLPIFPLEINKLNVLDFYCRYDEQLPLGEGIQIFLHVKYDSPELFNTEKQRIQSVAVACNEYFSNLDFSAYCVRIGKNYSSEYSLIDENSLEIYYIFVKGLSKDGIEFNMLFLPDFYEDYGNVNSVNQPNELSDSTVARTSQEITEPDSSVTVYTMNCIINEIDGDRFVAEKLVDGSKSGILYEFHFASDGYNEGEEIVVEYKYPIANSFPYGLTDVNIYKVQ